jgi:hypothetical protein
MRMRMNGGGGSSWGLCAIAMYDVLSHCFAQLSYINYIFPSNLY